MFMSKGVIPLRFGTPMPANSVSSVPISPMRAAMITRQLVARDDDEYVWFWYTTPGIIIKYVIFFSFLTILFGWVIGGRIHAKRRLRKGLKPLSYHGWLLSRQERAQVDPAYAYPTGPVVYGVYRPVYNGHNNGDANGADYYGMHSMPPPVYDPTRPPQYDGPPAGSKIDPQQDRSQQQQGQTQGSAPDYAPPAGPPPAR
ncbi:hypothetical protein F4808DRAFT_291572 [Astrocystis sublimbata]|nr:hypothetical protein F4808DRAFT_291572 [Astrocystis sublimbata]